MGGSSRGLTLRSEQVLLAPQIVLSMGFAYLLPTGLAVAAWAANLRSTRREALGPNDAGVPIPG